MKFPKLALVLPLVVSQSVFALAPSDEPSTCPKPEAFAAVGINNAEFDAESNMWVAYRPRNNFETANQWTLAVFPIDAKNTSDAVKQANKALPGLTFIDGPIQEDGMWGCVYINPSSTLMAIAVTPPILGNLMTLSNKFNLKAVH